MPNFNNGMNPVVHFEMPAEDRKRMIDFYTKAFGWQAKQMGAEYGDYVVVTTSESDPSDMSGRPKNPGMINGGFYQKTDDTMSQYPSVVIAVEDLKESIEKVKSAGGKIHGEIQDIPNVGMFVSVIDTEGNRISMLQPKMVS